MFADVKNRSSVSKDFDTFEVTHFQMTYTIDY